MEGCLWQMSFRIGVLKKFALLVGVRPATSWKRDSSTQVFFGEYCEIFKIIFFIEPCLWRLLLNQHWPQIISRISVIFKIVLFLVLSFYLNNYRYLCLHMKTICRGFRITTVFNFWVIHTRDISNICLQTYRNNKIW